MPELRWILVVAGLLLLAGLWWWETRRKARQQAEPEEAAETVTDDGAADQSAAPASREEDMPVIRATRRERGVVGRNPPVVEFPGDAEPELARPQRDDQFVPPSVPYRSMHEPLDEIPADLRNLPPHEKADADQRQPWVRTQPLDRKELAAGAAEYGKEAADGLDQDAAQAGQEGQADDAGEVPEPSTARQKIVALRLIADGRWPGRSVIDALGAEGLEYGKYSIYHRIRDDGKTIFFVASMVEPGSFDLDNVDSQSYPGVSVFAVVPGPIDAPTTFDMMLATARRLAERLSGHLQDEQGSTLTAQRILSLREELVHFEHVSRRVQRR